MPWLEFPNHFAGALSKPLVTPDGAGSKQLDDRISCHQTMAYVAACTHELRKQICHVLDGEGLMQIDGKHHAVRPPAEACRTVGGEEAESAAIRPARGSERKAQARRWPWPLQQQTAPIPMR